MATVDLDWSALDAGLSKTLFELLNKHLGSIERPNFIGPISVLGFEFGTEPPDVELVDVQDVFVDFMEDDGDGQDEAGEDAAAAAAAVDVRHEMRPDDHDSGRGPADAFDWSRRPSGMQDPGGIGSPVFTSPRPWGSPDVRTPSPALAYAPQEPASESAGDDVDQKSPTEPAEADPQSPTHPPPTSTPHPDLQLHLHVSHHSNLRITLFTSLLINYPSPAFMSLPVKLSIIGIVLDAEVVVAYEGSRRRVHLCILDDQVPSGLPRRPSSQSVTAGVEMMTAESSTAFSSSSTKPLPAGLRILPNIFLESEIGQADKHVLKNVSRVERFIQDTVRKVLEDELVYPNFITVVLSNP